MALMAHATLPRAVLSTVKIFVVYFCDSRGGLFCDFFAKRMPFIIFLQKLVGFVESIIPLNVTMLPESS